MYKTIVVHVSNSKGMTNTLKLAASLANRSGAHLIGTATSGLAELTYAMAMGAPVAMGPLVEADTLRIDAERLLSSFAEHCRELGVESYETRLLDVSAEEALLTQSRYCDLLMVSQQDVLEGGFLVTSHLNGALVSRAARPVLLVPPSCETSAPFDRVMVAWNGSLGVSHAVAFGMPLIHSAAKVYIAVCNPDLERIDVGGEPGADLATYLSRHHHDVELVRSDSDQPTEVALTNIAREVGADLMMTGAYGHSKLHEWVLGSTTKALVDLAHIPLLMSH
jgi:nucleotide-binding universal stress UspA family protein